MNQDRYDVIIIGTGAGGGTLARKLAPSGKRILMVERGEYLPREAENWDTRAVFDQKRYQAAETWYDKDDRPFRPYTHYWVGGNTKVYGAALLRMREDDFGAVRHFGGVSPSWPITYSELEPYYAQAERWYCVHGRRGDDPCEPAASSGFPYPALEHEPRIAELAADIRAQGYRPFAIPLGVRLGDEPRGQPPVRVARFDGYPDVTMAKADSQVCAVIPALRRGNVEILTGAYVEQLLTDRTGRVVSGVVVRKEGKSLRLGADIVVLACGAINSAAVLLRSANEQHPRGLANSSDQVGRNYMCHQNGLLIAVTEAPNPSVFQKTFGMTDFYRGDRESSLPLGVIQLMGKPDPATLEWLRGESLPGVAAEDLASRTIDFFLTAEDLPSPENRITLRPDGAIRVAYTLNNTEAYERLRARAQQVLTEAERRHGRAAPVFLHSRLGVSGVSHQNGTLRFGSDPRTSVLDAECRAHDLDNLYVADGSFFPSSSAVNPSLTIMANAIRVGDRILERLGASVPAAAHEESFA